jgi:hypothetical protein
MLILMPRMFLVCGAIEAVLYPDHCEYSLLSEGEIVNSSFPSFGEKMERDSKFDADLQMESSELISTHDAIWRENAKIVIDSLQMKAPIGAPVANGA